MNEPSWIPTSQRLPEKGQSVEWISPGGLQDRGKFLGGLIWMPAGSNSYVYYTPTYWRPSK